MLMPMKRGWFRDKDGTFYRNANLVEGEIKRMSYVWFWNWPRLLRLHREWEHVFRRGTVRKARLGWRDVEVKPGSFREAYPQYPIFWQFDDDRA